MQLTRRGLLVGAVAGGGLLVAYTLQPHRPTVPLPPTPGESAFNAWIKVASDGVVTVAVPQCEMGQGITTLLPQIVALELGADWRQIAVEPAVIDAAYANPVLAARWADLWAGVARPLASSPEALLARRFAARHRFMVTADGTSLAAYEAPAREAAAAVRCLLAMAAAARWQVAWEQCDVRDGFVGHAGRRLRFGDLAAAAATLTAPDAPPLRPEPARERPGLAAAETPPRFPRLDAPSKVDGSFRFAGDVRLPGLVYAAIAHGPIGDAELVSFDRSAASAIVGLVEVVESRRWLAAVATNWWAADRAVQAMSPRFRVRKAAESARIDRSVDRALRSGRAERLFEAGEPEAQIGERASLAARYEVAPALHATVETTTATARWSDGRLELWLGTQAPEQARRAAARALAIAAREIIVYPLPTGGSFDRRLEHEAGIEAATIARVAARPVQLVYSRHQEHLRGWPRAPAAAVLSARTVAAGGIAAWRARVAVPATAREFGRRLFAGDTAQAALAASAEESDPLAMEGALPAYAIPHLAIDHVPVAVGLPTGRYRGNAHGYTAFFTESFVDELARAARREPLSYRIEMLGADLRLAACLSAVARLGGWGGGAMASGEGLACHRMPDPANREGGGGRIAVIAAVRQSGPGLRVERLSAAVDLGRIIHLDIARQQIEGGLIFGLGMALGGSTRYRRGMPETSRLAGLALPLLADSPEIALEFIPSEAPPFDPGELGAVAVAPAVANALFTLSGVRARRLPLGSGAQAR